MGYYPDSQGECISFIDQLNAIPNCRLNVFNIDKYKFTFYPDRYNPVEIDYYYEPVYYNNSDHYKEAMKNIEFSINKMCERCNSGYLLNNDNGGCEYYDLNDCTLNSLLEKNILYDCINLCNNNRFPFIYLLLENNEIDKNEENYNKITNSQDIKQLYSFLDNRKTNEEIQNIFGKNSICLNIDEQQSDDFSNCRKVIYNPIKQTFQCFECDYYYYLDSEKKICLQDKEKMYNDDYYCYNEMHYRFNKPNYSCKECFNCDETLVTYKDGSKTCISNEKALDNCITANLISTYYLKNSYECTSCTINHMLYYSKFYQRNMCHNVFEKIIKKKRY